MGFLGTLAVQSLYTDSNHDGRIPSSPPHVFSFARAWRRAYLSQFIVPAVGLGLGLPKLPGRGLTRNLKEKRPKGREREEYFDEAKDRR